MLKSSRKRSKKSQEIRKLNASKKSKMKTFLRKVNLAISKKDKTLALNYFKVLQSILDRYASSKIIHKNKAARYKSRLSIKIRKIS